MSLNGKVAVVTGGANGIGLAVVEDLLNQGMKVVLSDIADQGQQVADGLKNENVCFVKCDISNEKDVENLVAETVKKFGKLDVFVANAGIPSEGALHELTTDHWKKIIDIDLTGTFFSNKYAVMQMRKQGTGGAIINVSSILGLVGDGIVAAYCSAKGAVNQMTKSAAIAYAKEGIRINAVAPGYIATALLEQLDKDKVEGIASLHPIGRLGKPEEVASAIRFLASDDASFVVGVILPVDGGYTAP